MLMTYLQIALLTFYVPFETRATSNRKAVGVCLTLIRDLTQSRLGDRTTPPITSFDCHVLAEGVALVYPHTSDEDGNRNMPSSSEQVGLGGD